MKKEEIISGIGVMMLFVGAAGIAGAIETETGFVLALLVSIIGVAMTATGLNMERKHNGKSFDGRFVTDYTAITRYRER